MPLDANELHEALEPYGYFDVVYTYPDFCLARRVDRSPSRIEIRMRFTDTADDAAWMRRKLLGKYEEVWDMLTRRFGLALEDFPAFEIRGRLMYRLGVGKPIVSEVYAEARYDCWVR